MRRSNRMGVYFHDMDNDSAIGRLSQGASSFANRADEFFLSDELRNRLEMLQHDIQSYGRILAAQRTADLAGTVPGFLAQLRK